MFSILGSKKKFFILVLISLLGISIFLIYLTLKTTLLSDSSVLKTFKKRLLFKENGITENELYFRTEEQNLDKILLDHLKITENQKSFLDGLPLPLNQSAQIPLAVVVENHPSSRPQMAGLAQAKIVYEVLVEGGITRFLAVFDADIVDKIGPVRSARPYLIHWAEEFGGMFVHVGGSEEAFAYLGRTGRILNVDENKGENTILRDFNYFAPHNAFTSTHRLLERFQNMHIDRKAELDKPFFQFKATEQPVQDLTITQITLDFSFASYRVKWFYDAVQNRYTRYLAGQAHGDITAKNVIVMFVNANLVPGDEKGHLNMPLLGTGKAFYYLDGQKFTGTWQKQNYQTKTVFYDTDGQEMQFNRGTTWIEVLDAQWKLNET